MLRKVRKGVKKFVVWENDSLDADPGPRKICLQKCCGDFLGLMAGPAGGDLLEIFLWIHYVLLLVAVVALRKTK